MTTTRFAMIFSWVFVFLGILGFVPIFTTGDGYLFGLFEVDGVHNTVHLLAGIIGLVMANKSPKLFLKIFGTLYLIVTLIGFFRADSVLGLFDVNRADNLLHLLLSVLALWYGFRKEPVQIK